MTTDALSSVPAAIAALAAVLALVLVLARMARRGLLPVSGLLPARKPGTRRLAIQEAVALDSRRRLCLVSCDGHSLLLLTGGTQDAVIGWLPWEQTGKLQEQGPVAP